MKSKPSCSQHLETLIALVTHLAMTDWAMRSPPNLAKALSIDEKKIEEVLNSFKGVFRKSDRTSSKTGAHFYTLQLRYARQWLQDDADEESKKVPLEPEYLTALLEFITHKSQEEAGRYLGLATAWVSAAAAVIVALVAIVSK